LEGENEGNKSFRTTKKLKKEFMGGGGGNRSREKSERKVSLNLSVPSFAAIEKKGLSSSLQPVLVGLGPKGDDERNLRAMRAD